MTTRVSPRQPVILDDDWQPPPRPSRVRFFLTATAIGLGIASVGFVSIRAAIQPPQIDQPVQAPSRRYDLGYPDPGESRWSPLKPSGVPAKSEPPAAPKSTPRPPTASLPGRLAVSSTPWAELSVDGRVVGNTPQVGIRVTPGRHLLMLARDGFQNHTISVIVRPGATLKITGIALKRIAP